MKRTRQVTFAGVLLLLATTGVCAPVQRDALDIRPQGGDAAATAAVCQTENAERLARETSASVLDGFVATPQAADALLADVKGAYETDPLRAVQIAAVTQRTMTPKCERAARGRKVWTEALLRAARASADATRTMFFLDQLRGCGFPSQVAAIRALGEKRETCVRDYADWAARELESAPVPTGLSWCVFGTSISWYDAHASEYGEAKFTRGYQSRVKDRLSFTDYHNLAINGGVIGGHRWAKVPRADLYTIEHGINDWGHRVPVGTLADYRVGTNANTFAANYRILVDKIRKANPHAVIVLCTPRRGYGFGTYLPASSDAPHGGIYLKEYARLVRAIAADEGFEVADFFADCGTDEELADLSIDVALHPNDAGFQRMADCLEKAIRRATLERREGFRSLFNGQDLTGWRWSGAVPCYGVEPTEPGILQYIPGTMERHKLCPGTDEQLVTQKSFRDFVLRFDFLMPTNGNNGIGVRMAEKGNPTYTALCEIQLLDDGGDAYYDASAKRDKCAPTQYCGAVYGLAPARRDNPAAKGFAVGGSYAHPAGQWNDCEIEVVGSTVRVTLNGVEVSRADLSAFQGDGDTPDCKPHPGIRRTEGAIGLLGYAGFNVRFRNLRARDVSAR